MKISARLVSSRPISLTRAANGLSRFASADDVSSGAVCLYLQRTADAFNHLVQFHSKHKRNHAQNYPDMKRVQRLQRDWEGGNPQDTSEPIMDEGDKGYSEMGQRNDEKVPEVVNPENSVPDQEKKEKKKKKKKRKNREIDGGGDLESEKVEKKSKKRRTEVSNS